MKPLTPLLLKAIRSAHFKPNPPAIYQAVFQKHGIALTIEQAFIPGNLSEAEHIKAILDKPEIQTKWYTAKNGYSTPQEIDKLSSDAIAMMEKKSRPTPA